MRGRPTYHCLPGSAVWTWPLNGPDFGLLVSANMPISRARSWKSTGQMFKDGGISGMSQGYPWIERALERSPLSPEASRANRTALQVNAWHLVMSVICGENLQESFTKLAPVGRGRKCTRAAIK